MIHEYAKITRYIMRRVNDMNEKLLKTIGNTATIIGLGASLIHGIVNDKKMDLILNKKIAEAITKLNGKS